MTPLFQSAIDAILGPCIRRIPDETARLFLTFDDGPDPHCTPRVLRLLEKHQAQATFFVIATSAETHRALLHETLAAGHALGNHSLDHTYQPYFRSDRHLRDWIAAADERLASLTGRRPLGFRSPAGVRTPPLGRCLRELRMRLVHWNVRFFETQRPWTPERAHSSWHRTPPGSIVLLHDAQHEARRERFLQTLDEYLAEGRARGFQFAALSEHDLARACPGNAPM